MPFRLGDRISAGHLTIEFADAASATANTVMFVENGESFSNTSTTVVASLDARAGPAGRRSQQNLRDAGQPADAGADSRRAASWPGTVRWMSCSR